MTRRRHRARQVGILTVVALLIWLGWQLSGMKSGHGVQEEAAGDIPEVAPAAMPLDRMPIRGTEEPGPTAQAEAFGQLVSAADGGDLSVSGMVRLDLAFEDGSAHGVEVPVSAGRFPLDQSQYAALSERSFTEWALALWSDQIAHSAASDFSANSRSDQNCISFRMPASRAVKVHVTDLKGDPVADAVVDCDLRSGWVQWGRGEVRTDGAGIAQFTVLAELSTIPVRASKAGYVTSSEVLQSSGQPLSICLPRLLGVCVVHSDKVMLQELRTMKGASGYLYAIRDDDITALMAQHEARFPIEDIEEYRWDVIGEMSWLEAPQCMLSYQGWFGGFLGSMTIPFQHLASEAFEVRRLPESVREGAEALHEVQFDVEPASAFLAEPPERIQLRVISNDLKHTLNLPLEEPGQRVGFPVSPRRIAGTRYRAFLPEGEFAIEAAGHDWQSRLPHKDPALLANIHFAVRAGVTGPPVTIALHPGESFVRQRLVDSFGRALDVGAILLPEDESLGDFMLGYFATAGRTHLDRFVRPGNYSLWIHDWDRVGSVRLPGRIVWNGEAAPGGLWNVRVDLALLDPAVVLR